MGLSLRPVVYGDSGVSEKVIEPAPIIEESPTVSAGEHRALEGGILLIAQQLSVLNRNLTCILEVFPNLKSQPILVNGKLTQLVSRDELASSLGVSAGTIDRWSKNGTIPNPFNPDRGKRGPKLLKWDLYEAVEWIRKYR